MLLRTWRLYQIQNNKLLKKKVRYWNYLIVIFYIYGSPQIRFISNTAIFILAIILLSPVVILLLLQIIIDRPRFNTELMEIEVINLNWYIAN